MPTAPSLMYEHGFDAKKGWFQPSALDYSAKMADAVTFDVPSGRVVHLDADGKFTPGCHNTGVAIFLLNGSNDYDVNNPGTTPSGLFMHKAVMPSGDMSGLVATGGYELDNTEFDDTQTYVPGDLLTAAASPTDADTGGLLTNEGVEQFVTPICGVVSSGAHKNHNGVRTLSFWTVWLPGEA